LGKQGNPEGCTENKVAKIKRRRGVIKHIRGIGKKKKKKNKITEGTNKERKLPLMEDINKK